MACRCGVHESEFVGNEDQCPKCGRFNKAKCRVCHKGVLSGDDKLSTYLHKSCWNHIHKRLKVYGPEIKIKTWRFRLEINLHDLWIGVFWITSREIYIGVPCLVLHIYNEDDYIHEKSRYALK